MKRFGLLLLACPLIVSAAQQVPISSTPDMPKDEGRAPIIQQSTNTPASPRTLATGNTSDAAYVDLDYAWDEFNHRGTLVWGCRGVQTGKFVSESLCFAQPKVDSHWPSKNVPANWDGATRQ